MLLDITPLLTDCGLRCGGACCAPDEDGQGGVYLFPGEARRYANCEWAEIIETPFAPMLVCKGACDREKRPLGCRIFPLTPAFTKSGKVFPRVDRRAFAVCPLAPGGLRALNPEFVARVGAAFEILQKSPETEKFLRAWWREERRYYTAL